MTYNEEELAKRDEHHYYSILADFVDVVRAFGSVAVVHDLALLFPVETKELKQELTKRQSGVLLEGK